MTFSPFQTLFLPTLFFLGGAGLAVALGILEYGQCALAKLRDKHARA